MDRYIVIEISEGSGRPGPAGKDGITPGRTVLDRTGLTSYYELLAGETIKIDFTDSATVPLYITCPSAGAIYQIYTLLPYAQSGQSMSGVLLPNDIWWPADTFNSIQFYYWWDKENVNFGAAAQMWAAVDGVKALMLFDGMAQFCEAKISTFPKTKCLISSSVGNGHNGSVNTGFETHGARWEDGETTWASLGTLVFTNVPEQANRPQTGTVFIQRLL